jgi:UDP-N-acetylmuramate: L-alanyl-gamma-D-glutamyl-meso-diaminopimelate ligase
VEFDHADIYRDLAHVKQAFTQLLELIPADGTLIYNGEDKNILDILPACKARNKFSYGTKKGDFHMSEREVIEGRNQFAVLHKGERIADLALKIFGEHNSMNALAVFAMAEARGWPRPKVLQALADFKGVKRRQEILGEIGGVTVVEDFAHHPTAVDLTLKCMRERFPGRRVIAVFEPRSATSRRKVFQEEYAKAFRHADLIFVATPFDQSKIEVSNRFSTEELIQDLRQHGKTAEMASSVDAILNQMVPLVQPKDVILVMSNGGFDNIYQKLLAQLKT